MDEPKLVLWDIAGLQRLDGNENTRFEKIRKMLDSMKTVHHGVLSALPPQLTVGDLRLFLRDQLIEHYFENDLLINASLLPVSLPDTRVFLAAAALSGFSASEICFISNNSILLKAAESVGMLATQIFDDAVTAAAAPAIPIDQYSGPTFILQGRIVTMNDSSDVLNNGRIVIKGGEIIAVLSEGQPLPAGFSNAPIIDTACTIFPGLIDLHNHYAYNILTLWKVPAKYENRTKWQRNKDYRLRVSGPMGVIAAVPSLAQSIVRYVEAKAIVGGTTTGQGIRMKVQSVQGLAKGMMRNIELTNDTKLPEGATRIPDLDLGKPNDLDSFRKSLNGGKSMFYHLAEGVDDDARQRYTDLRDNDLIRTNLSGIHCLALKNSDLQEMSAHQAKVIWSPFSNLLLYGQTLDLASVTGAGIDVALGCDWSPSGSKNLLQEMKIARWESTRQGLPLSAKELVKMVTRTPAKLLQWDKALGQLSKGFLADLVAIRGVDGDNPYELLVDALERDVQLVCVHGVPRYGDASLMRSLVFPNSSLEKVSVDGIDKSFFFESPSSPINGLSLGTATSRLKEAMENVDALSSQIESNQLLTASEEPGFELLLDMQPDDAEEFDAAAAAPTPTPALILDPIFVEGASYISNNIVPQQNIPNALKVFLHDIYH